MGDIIEVRLGSGRIAYLHYCCDWRKATLLVPVVRALPGRWEEPLGRERLRDLVAGRDDFVRLCFVQQFVTGADIEVVDNVGGPENRRSLPGVWSIRRSDDLAEGRIVAADGVYQSAASYAQYVRHGQHKRVYHFSMRGSSPHRTLMEVWP
jgi:hypothetical protein